MGLGRTLIGIGIVLVLAGVIITVLGRWTNLGRLPGDLVFRRDNVTFHFPLATSILLSVLLSAVFWFFRRNN